MMVDLFWKDLELTSRCAYKFQYSFFCYINFLNSDASLKPFTLLNVECFTHGLFAILLELILECLNFIVSLSE
jgi:hypothetical protein